MTWPREATGGESPGAQSRAGGKRVERESEGANGVSSKGNRCKRKRSR